MKQSKKSFLQKNLPLLAILFVLGIIFLYLSEYDSNKRNGNSSFDFDSKSYTEDLEERLCAMLEKMDGVEDVSVMITLETSSRYQITGSKGNPYDSNTYVNAFSLQSDSADGEPAVMEIKAPKIKGVSVVCIGAENIRIRERIINLISSTLNLTKNRIYVTE